MLLSTLLTTLATDAAAKGLPAPTVVAVDCTPSDVVVNLVLSDGAIFKRTGVAHTVTHGVLMLRIHAAVDGATLRISRRPDGVIANRATSSTNLSELPLTPFIPDATDTVLPLSDVSVEANGAV